MSALNVHGQHTENAQRGKEKLDTPTTYTSDTDIHSPCRGMSAVRVSGSNEETDRINYCYAY